MKNIHSIRMEKQFVLDYNDVHEGTDIDSDIGFQTAGFTYLKQYLQNNIPSYVNI